MLKIEWKRDKRKIFITFLLYLVILSYFAGLYLVSQSVYIQSVSMQTNNFEGSNIDLQGSIDFQSVSSNLSTITANIETKLADWNSELQYLFSNSTISYKLFPFLHQNIVLQTNSDFGIETNISSQFEDIMVYTVSSATFTVITNSSNKKFMLFSNIANDTYPNNTIENISLFLEPNSQNASFLLNFNNGLILPKNNSLTFNAFGLNTLLDNHVSDKNILILPGLQYENYFSLLSDKLNNLYPDTTKKTTNAFEFYEQIQFSKNVSLVEIHPTIDNWNLLTWYRDQLSKTISSDQGFGESTVTLYSPYFDSILQIDTLFRQNDMFLVLLITSPILFFLIYYFFQYNVFNLRDTNKRKTDQYCVLRGINILQLNLIYFIIQSGLAIISFLVVFITTSTFSSFLGMTEGIDSLLTSSNSIISCELVLAINIIYLILNLHTVKSLNNHYTNDRSRKIFGMPGKQFFSRNKLPIFIVLFFSNILVLTYDLYSMPILSGTVLDVFVLNIETSYSILFFSLLIFLLLFFLSKIFSSFVHILSSIFVLIAEKRSKFILFSHQIKKHLSKSNISITFISITIMLIIFNVGFIQGGIAYNNDLFLLEHGTPYVNSYDKLIPANNSLSTFKTEMNSVFTQNSKISNDQVAYELTLSKPLNNSYSVNGKILSSISITIPSDNYFSVVENSSAYQLQSYSGYELNLSNNIDPWIISQKEITGLALNNSNSNAIPLSWLNGTSSYLNLNGSYIYWPEITNFNYQSTEFSYFNFEIVMNWAMAQEVFLNTNLTSLGFFPNIRLFVFSTINIHNNPSIFIEQNLNLLNWTPGYSTSLEANSQIKSEFDLLFSLTQNLSIIFIILLLIVNLYLQDYLFFSENNEERLQIVLGITEKKIINYSLISTIISYIIGAIIGIVVGLLSISLFYQLVNLSGTSYLYSYLRKYISFISIQLPILLILIIIAIYMIVSIVFRSIFLKKKLNSLILTRPSWDE